MDLYQLDGESDRDYARRCSKVTGTVDDILADVWQAEFVRNGLCMLCGNSGLINTTRTISGPVGQICGGIAHCICPNGRRRKVIEGHLPNAAS